MPKTLVNVTLPVLNEEAQLAASVAKLHQFVETHCSFDCEITIADNGSTDRTLEIASALATKYPTVRVVHLNQRGRGRALRHVWLQSSADILSYMDIDLSTDLRAFPPLIEALTSGRYDIGIGSRLLPNSHTVRGLKRELISRIYNGIIKVACRTHFSDAQCGFKALTRNAAITLLPLIEDNGWFLDTELLILAEKFGWRIFEVPVDWVDDPDTRVRLVSTAWKDLKGLARVRYNFLRAKYPNAPRPFAQTHRDSSVPLGGNARSP